MRQTTEEFNRARAEQELQGTLRILRASLKDAAMMIGAVVDAGDAAHLDVDQARAELLQAMLDSVTPKIIHAIGTRAREEASHRVVFLSSAPRGALVLMGEPVQLWSIDATVPQMGNLVRMEPIQPRQAVAVGWTDVVGYLETLTAALEGYTGTSGKRGGVKGRTEKDRALAACFRAAVTLLRGS
jgi:hypothetical protein